MSKDEKKYKIELTEGQIFQIDQILGEEINRELENTRQSKIKKADLLNLKILFQDAIVLTFGDLSLTWDHVKERIEKKREKIGEML